MPDKDFSCEEKLRLSEAVVKAVDTVYHAKSAQDKLVARSVERDAVRALDQHRKEHGC